MARPNGVESAKELLEAQAHVWNHTFNYINSLSLKCAVQLGIPDAIHKHGKPITLPELAKALSINKAKSENLSRLMRVLVHSKFFNKVKISSEDKKEEAYSLTRASRLLMKDEPLSMATYVVGMVERILIDPMHHMSEWFGDENPTPFITRNGEPFWEYTRKEEKWNHLLNESMACDARLVASILVQECRQVFEGVATLVDVAGGTGTVARAVAGAFPGLKCIVLDLPHVVAGLEGSENLSYVVGDMFVSIPHGDAVFLKWILHDWNDEECVKILEKCKEAITPSKNEGKKVIIVDMVVDVEREKYEETESQLFLDILMMAEVTGKERTEKEWDKIFMAAGFKNYKISPVLGLRSVIEWILHDWNDEECVKILEKCKEAITPSKNEGNKVIIVDMVVDVEREKYEETESQLFLDILMMAEVTGKERTEKEWDKIFMAAGFKNYKISPVLGLRSVIEVFP